jgi:hypothetical protein
MLPGSTNANVPRPTMVQPVKVFAFDNGFPAVFGGIGI